MSEKLSYDGMAFNVSREDVAWRLEPHELRSGQKDGLLEVTSRAR